MLLDRDNYHYIYLELGSNLGDRGENLKHAINNIEERIGEVVTTSAFYVTTPEGFISENQFLNAVCGVKTRMDAFEILDITQQIEKDMGRESKSRDKIYSDRIIDIDLLLFDDEIVRKENLELPHPHLHERAFVLIPLAEIAGNYIHPVFEKTISQLKEELNSVNSYQ